MLVALSNCVLASLIHSFNLSSAIIQVAWITISVVGITRMAFVNLRLRFTEDERAFVEDMLKGLPLAQARMLLDTGFWVGAEPGSVLTVQGKPVDHLCYLASGKAEVLVDGKLVNADVMLAVGTRFPETDSSSWERR